MNTQQQPQHLQPEQWLIASDDSARISALQAELASQADTLMAWRLKNGLAKLLSMEDLDGAATQALAGAAPLVHVYADLSATQAALRRQHLCAAVGAQSALRLRLRDWGPAGHDALMAELAQPDSWVVLGWAHTGGQHVPPLRAMADQPEIVAKYEAAFQQWATSSEAEGALQAARELQEVIAETEAAEQTLEDLSPQPDPGEWNPFDSRVRTQEGQVINRQPDSRQALRLSAAAARAAGVDARPAKEVLMTWQARPENRPFEAKLLASGTGPSTSLSIEVQLIDCRDWKDARDLQVWLFPPQMRPLLVALGDPLSAGHPDNGRLLLSAPLPLRNRDVSALAKALSQPHAKLRLDYATAPK